MRKIAIVGSADSVAFAPFDNDTWEIWTCSPSNEKLPRVTRWFELHPPEWVERYAAPWLKFLSTEPNVIAMFPRGPLSNAAPYPVDAVVENFGTHFFTSSIAWMMALALFEAKAADVPLSLGIWGVDMASQDERYSHQREGCQHFVAVARLMGFDVTFPRDADFMLPGRLYGIGMDDPAYIAMADRLKVLRSEEADTAQAMTNLQRAQEFRAGQIDALRWSMSLKAAER